MFRDKLHAKFRELLARLAHHELEIPILSATSINQLLTNFKLLFEISNLNFEHQVAGVNFFVNLITHNVGGICADEMVHLSIIKFGDGLIEQWPSSQLLRKDLENRIKLCRIFLVDSYRLE